METDPLIIRTEADVMASWDANDSPYVSICCATFNHAKYLVDALQGFLGQITSFPFEIIIRDDASTDGTTEIVRDFAERYPQIVRAVIETENQFKKGVRPVHAWSDIVKGEFVAFCEGDDYWTSPLKLQKQIELLEKYPNAVMSVAKTEICEQDEESIRPVDTINGNDKVVQEFEEIKKTYFHTSTYVIRANIFKEVIGKYFKGHCLFGDTALRFLLISYGPFVFLPEIVSVYRVTGNGIWSSLDLDSQLAWELEVVKKLHGALKGEHKEFQWIRLSQIHLAILKNKFKRSIKSERPIIRVISHVRFFLIKAQIKLGRKYKATRRYFVRGLGNNA